MNVFNMKRLFLSIIVVIILSPCLSGCESLTKSPKQVADEAMTLVENKDYRGYVDLMYIENPNVADINDQKNMVADFIRQKFESAFSMYGGIKSHRILTTTID
jgi:predicted small lipoprotein YifL